MIEMRAEIRQIWNQAIVLRTGIGRFVRCKGLNISTHGIGIESLAKLVKGEAVKVFLRPQESQTAVPVLTEVVWCRKKAGFLQAGLRFLV